MQKHCFKMYPLRRASTKSFVFAGQKRHLNVDRRPKCKEKDEFSNASGLDIAWMRCCLPVLNEHGRAQRGQFLCCHQLADERMALGVQTPRLCGVSKQVRQELVVLGHCIANVLFPQSSGVAIQLHGAAVWERKEEEYQLKYFVHAQHIFISMHLRRTQKNPVFNSCSLQLKAVI